jgi:hypothetical protein
MSSKKFKLEESYYLHHTGEKCAICGEGLTHPPIKLPAGPAYVKLNNDNIQSANPLLEYPTITVCWRHAIELLADLVYDPNNPTEGEWYRKWKNGDLEPKGLLNDTDDSND